ncbi:unnamed protein product [Symbiodinium necroappetens]|uniref:DUF547 domain-containing protein n=1 Tax=Symbiodinium necroappetens TaxID=1628268 RepID=A0A813CKW4_9DINO|nr:unnamed protein product [Symbiodinium necroappetens]
MCAARSRPFFLSLGTTNGERVPVEINGAPVEFDSPGFKGLFHVIHDTGNEPGNVKPEHTNGPRKGLIVQFQGKFKHNATMGQENSTNIWAGGTLDGELNLGWIMSNVVSVGAKFAKKKTGGRFVIDLGSKTSPCQMGFHIRALMCFVRTPDGEEPPPLGSEEVENVAWAGPGLLEVDTTSTYTFIWRVAYLDLCTWELLKVPAISPLPLESVLGEIKSGCAFIYDLGRCGGEHGSWRDSLILQIFFARGSQGDEWQVERRPSMDAPAGMDDESPKTVLEVASDASEEVSAAGSDVQLVTADDQSDSETTQDSLDDDEAMYDQDEEEIRELSKSHSQALLQIESWRPRNVDEILPDKLQVQVPFYIEAIDRFRRRKVRYWYIFSLTDPGGTFWTAKDSQELASLCRPKRRLRTFRRGPGARRYTCCAVKTLEQFRTVVSSHLDLESESKLRSVVVRAAVTGSMTPDQTDASVEGSPRPDSGHLSSPARLARKVRRRTLGQRRRVQLMPPRFFVAADSIICGLAFAHARQGRASVIREALVGSVHFEGRICEELLRLSSDGFLRCFTPYDCEKPRISVHAGEILQIEALPGPTLGRFMLWQVHTFLRVFVFCCADSAEREQWISNLSRMVAQVGGDAHHADGAYQKDSKLSPEIGSPREPPSQEPPSPKTPATWKSGRSNPVDVFGFSIAKKAAGRVAGGARNGLRAITGGQRVPSKEAMLLMDSTRSRRWGHRRRLVLNDRILASLPEKRLAPDFAACLLEKALSLGAAPAAADVTAFLDATCLFKAVSFQNWTEAEMLTFWVNTYHCILLHGLLIFGAPQSKSELNNFRNRVSYLIGSRPMSLREIDSAMLRVPKTDPQAARQARVRARQLLGFCGLCRKGATPPDPSSPASQHGQQRLPDAPMCLPKMPLPKGPWTYDKTQACLYIGSPPELWLPPKQDLRVVLTLNRGTLSSLSAVPIFDAASMDSQLNEMAHQFVGTFVEVQLRDGIPQKVTLPVWCRVLLQEFRDDEAQLLSFVWKFMSKEVPQLPDKKVQLKFKKFPQESRQRVQFFKAILGAQEAKPTSAFYALDGAAKAAHLTLLTRGQNSQALPLTVTEPEPEHDDEFKDLSLISL